MHTKTPEFLQGLTPTSLQSSVRPPTWFSKYLLHDSDASNMLQMLQNSYLQHFGSVQKNWGQLYDWFQTAVGKRDYQEGLMTSSSTLEGFQKNYKPGISRLAGAVY